MAFNDKTFTIYTSTANSRKVLKRHTQILLTVTPCDQKDLFVSQTPLAWKVLDFAPQSDISYTIVWQADPAFAIVGTETSTHVSLRAFMQLGSSGVLKVMGGGTQWSSAQGRRGYVMARNETPIPRAFTLGSVNEDDDFEGFVRFAPTPAGSAVMVEPAVMLQAYTVTGYRPGKLLSQVDSSSFIFRKFDDSPSPLNLATLQNGTALNLSSEPSGRLVLE
ncbi:hypothetical protein EIP91_010133 [Steccherinum ochraceum]|uniref:Uncharacterized protein n=1 Tax=Steccherinum ochraceum TaxID=92696 RepID=A0A4V2MXT9_9APHY|nr:hypothetical protein EIP91_010133 [Steccherinum ochraceum]